MSRTIFLIALVVIFVGSLVVYDQMFKKTAVAVVDIEYVLNNSNPGKAGNAYLQRVKNEHDKKFAEIQEQLKKDPKNVALQKYAQNVYAVLQQHINTEQRNISLAINTALQNVLEDYRAQNNLNSIVNKNTVLVHDKDLDITAAITESINSVPVELTSVPLQNIPKFTQKTPQKAPQKTPEKAPKS